MSFVEALNIHKLLAITRRAPLISEKIYVFNLQINARNFSVRSEKKGGGRSPQKQKDRSVKWNKNKGFQLQRDSIFHEKHRKKSLGRGGQISGDDFQGNQVVGRVLAAQANFLKVLVTRYSQEQSIEVESDSTTITSGVEDSVATAESGKVGIELLCVVKSLLKKMKRRVLVGDDVVLGSIDWVDGRGVVEGILPRQSEIHDPPIANVNMLLILFSLSRPALEPTNLSRFLVAAEATGVAFEIVLNKADLVEPEECESWRSRLRSWGYQPHICSVEKGIGLTDLNNCMRGRISVLAGPSGVGKSSLINSLRRNPSLSSPSLCSPKEGTHSVPESLVESRNSLIELAGQLYSEGKLRTEGANANDLSSLPEVDGSLLDQRVSNVSDRTGRGKHTTRHVELLYLPLGGLLADTPGFSQPSLTGVSSADLQYLFPEICNKFEEDKRCTFRDCLHIGEPGCVVGDSWERYPLYRAVLEEVKAREVAEKVSLGTKRESDVRLKSGLHGVQSVEPMLDRKKHRQESRNVTNQKTKQAVTEGEDEHFISIK